ncbi:MAG: ABC transporter permease [Planctomycetota bacterium]|nr:ABC transporter permease [Planctomycetota bacterium]
MVQRSLRQHALSSMITAMSMALGVGLVMAVFAVNEQTRNAFTGGKVGFDAVLGARGSKLQLVLNAVFHLETSPGNIPWKLYKDMKKRPEVALAIPYAVGDNYRGYRVVGTSGELFTKLEFEKGETYRFQEGGRVFDPDYREAVIGSFVAQKTGLEVGSKFNPSHGVFDSEAAEKHGEYVVVGVLEPTNSPVDRVVWIPIEGVFRMGGHVLRGTGQVYVAEDDEEIPDEHKEVSAVMVKFHSPVMGQLLALQINNRGKVATMAYPIAAEMADLFNKIGWIHSVLTLVAYLIVVVAAASLLAAIYNTMNERRREMAIMRALGARRVTLFGVIILESATIASFGAILGFVVYYVILSIVAVLIRNETGVVIDITAWNPSLLTVPPGAIVVGAFAGLIPAFKAYRTDVAENLDPLS